MRNADSWHPSKFVMRRGRLRASRDPGEVRPSSVLTADRVAAAYQRHLPPYCGGALLDVGCGKVPLFGLYCDLVEHTVCVDRRDSIHGVDHLDAFIDVSEGLPVRSSLFDTVLASDVLEHSPNPPLLVSEMARALRPGGHLILSVPFYYPLHEMPDDYYRLTETALRKLSADAGLEVILLDSLGGAPEVLGDLLGKTSAALPLIGGPLCMATRVFFSTLGRTLPGRWLSRATCRSFPLGYFMVARRPEEGAG